MIFCYSTVAVNRETGEIAFIGGNIEAPSAEIAQKALELNFLGNHLALDRVLPDHAWTKPMIMVFDPRDTPVDHRYHVAVASGAFDSPI